MRAILSIVALSLLLVAGTAAAEEIVFFTNGTSMPVRGHAIEGDMIRVDLGDDGEMAFPRAQVERIESAGRAVFPGNAGPANRIIEDGAERSYPVRGRRPGRYNRSRALGAQPPEADPAIGKDASGMPVYRPLIDSSNAAARKIGVTGHAAVRGNDGEAPGGRVDGPRRSGRTGPQRYNAKGRNDAKPTVTGITRNKSAGAPSSGSSGKSSGGDDN